VHDVNKFRHYITGYQVYVRTDHVAIKYLMNKTDVISRIIIRLLLLQQFDITIMDKPRKHNVVVYFLSRSEHTIEREMIDNVLPDEHLFVFSITTPWFDDIENYLETTRFPQHVTYKQKSRIVRQSAYFSWIKGYLFKLGPDHVLRRCIREDETYDILHACHNTPPGVHYSSKKTIYKILQAGYFWPTLHKDAHQYVSHCDECQRMGQPTKRDELPLHPITTYEPFDKWSMDFIGPIDPPSHQKNYILVCTDYLTKWVDVKALRETNETIVV
jgi:hypothetical protein